MTQIEALDSLKLLVNGQYIIDAATLQTDFLYWADPMGWRLQEAMLYDRSRGALKLAKPGKEAHVR